MYADQPTSSRTLPSLHDITLHGSTKLLTSAPSRVSCLLKLHPFYSAPFSVSSQTIRRILTCSESQNEDRDIRLLQWLCTFLLDHAMRTGSIDRTQPMRAPPSGKQAGVPHLTYRKLGLVYIQYAKNMRMASGMGVYTLN